MKIATAKAFFVLMVVILTTFFISGLHSIFFIELPSSKKPLIFYSNQTHTSLKSVFLKACKECKRSLIIHTFALTDLQTLKRLKSLAKDGIYLKILSDQRNLPHFYSDLKNTLKWQSIKTSGLMHQKVLLVDDSLSFLGTANMTYESMKMHDNVVIGIFSEQLNTYLKDYTEKIPLKRAKKNTQPQLFSINNQTLELWMLPFKGTKPLERLLELIEQATRSIDISIFTLTHPKILSSLKNASDRGVKVCVYLDKTSSQGASSKALEYLKNSSIEVKISQGIQLLHHKMMMIDGKYFILGSANWTKSAFEKNHDFFLVLAPLSPYEKKQILSIFKAIKKESK